MAVCGWIGFSSPTRRTGREFPTPNAARIDVGICSRAHEWLSVAQLRQKLTLVCAHAMKCHGDCLLQRSARKFPLTLTHACRHLLICSCVAWRCSATHSRTQHAFDSIHTTHLLFSSAYTSAVHASSISDKAVGVCVCAGGKISRLHTHLSILLV